MSLDNRSVTHSYSIEKRKISKHSIGFMGVADSTNSLAVSCTIIYAMSQLFCGIVLPLSDSFVTNSDYESNHTYYLEIYLIIQYVLALLSIFFLQGYIHISEKYSKKTVKGTCKTLSELFENSNKKDPNQVEVLDNKEDKSDSKERNKFSEPSGSTSDRSNSFNKFNIDPDVDASDSQSVYNEFILNDNEGINIYLRLGAVGFGFGVMVHDGFKIADQVRTSNVVCHNHLWIPKQSLHLAKIFFQTFFIFKYHRVIYLKHKAIVRFILYHLTMLNICEWFKTVVYEINHELIEHKIRFIDKINLNTTGSCDDQLSHYVSPFLFPCAIEYSLISAAVFYKMFQKVDMRFAKMQHSKSIIINENENTNRNKISNQSDDNYSEINNENYFENDIIRFECHKAHKGLFIGLFVFMTTLVGLAMFMLFKKNKNTQALAIMVYQISEISLLFFSVIALIAAFIQMKQLGFRQLTEEEAFDSSLILVSLAGVFTYNLFLFISTIDSSIRVKYKKNSLTISLFLCKSFTEILQSLIQVLFVMESSRKCAKDLKQFLLKPGRSLVTFLIITNLALWMIGIFEAKRADEHLIFTEYYQKIPWTIITHTLLPLIIFFRFHSSICLTVIWSKSYGKIIPQKKV